MKPRRDCTINPCRNNDINLLTGNPRREDRTTSLMRTQDGQKKIEQSHWPCLLLPAHTFIRQNDLSSRPFDQTWIWAVSLLYCGIERKGKVSRGFSLCQIDSKTCSFLCCLVLTRFPKGCKKREILASGGQKPSLNSSQKSKFKSSTINLKEGNAPGKKPLTTNKTIEKGSPNYYSRYNRNCLGWNYYSRYNRLLPRLPISVLGWNYLTEREGSFPSISILTGKRSKPSGPCLNLSPDSQPSLGCWHCVMLRHEASSPEYDRCGKVAKEVGERNIESLPDETRPLIKAGVEGIVGTRAASIRAPALIETRDHTLTMARTFNGLRSPFLKERRRSYRPVSSRKRKKRVDG
ncbi:mono-/di-acylglycerol lipase [Striga asiatica]|uniref:Mono-/di-acylglycerol lipase n=1 Tax=Striga asiatica TaxID=4170 RepID=A0A5A7PPP3_STRAF|nr:mono-/di-acylglycerol lipase [Striga asiatica]